LVLRGRKRKSSTRLAGVSRISLYTYSKREKADDLFAHLEKAVSVFSPRGKTEHFHPRRKGKGKRLFHCTGPLLQCKGKGGGSSPLWGRREKEAAVFGTGIVSELSL